MINIEEIKVIEHTGNNMQKSTLQKNFTLNDVINGKNDPLFILLPQLIAQRLVNQQHFPTVCGRQTLLKCSKIFDNISIWSGNEFVMPSKMDRVATISQGVAVISVHERKYANITGHTISLLSPRGLCKSNPWSVIIQAMKYDSKNYSRHGRSYQR